MYLTVCMLHPKKILKKILIFILCKPHPSHRLNCWYHIAVIKILLYLVIIVSLFVPSSECSCSALYSESTIIYLSHPLLASHLSPSTPANHLPHFWLPELWILLPTSCHSFPKCSIWASATLCCNCSSGSQDHPLTRQPSCQ
jgi:hypothetical protein